MLAGKGVAFDKTEMGPIRESIAQQGRQIAVNFDRQHMSGSFEQFFGKGAGARPDFDDPILARQVSGISHQPNEVLVNHEILSEPMPGRRPGLGQQVFDLMFRLGHV